MILSRMYFFNFFLIKIKLTLLYGVENQKNVKKKEKSSHATLKVSGNVIVIRKKKVLDVFEFFFFKKKVLDVLNFFQKKFWSFFEFFSKKSFDRF